MKKIILIFMIFSIGIFAKSFDSTESKKALDKFIEIERSGDFKKYAGDKQAEAMFSISNMTEQEIRSMNTGKKIIGENYKYKITNVKETGNKSENMEKVLEDLQAQYGEEWADNLSTEEVADRIMEKYTDFLVVKQTIKVNLEKEKGYWLIDLNENQDFMISLYSHGELYFWHE